MLNSVTTKQAMRGHIIVADGWAGASNPHPHPTPHQTPLLSQTHLQKASRTLVFPLFDSITSTDGPRDGRTDKASYRVACPQLKKKRSLHLHVVAFSVLSLGPPSCITWPLFAQRENPGQLDPRLYLISDPRFGLFVLWSVFCLSFHHRWNRRALALFVVIQQI